MSERIWAGEGPVLADTTAWSAAARDPALQERFEGALAAGDIRWCLPTRYERLFAARDREAIDAVDATFGPLREIPIDRAIQLGAIGAMRELAERGPAGAHRMPFADLLIAAAAQARGIAVLHYDRHFDRLAALLGFASLWIAAPGSL